MRPSPLRPRLRLVVACTALLAASCSDSPIEWTASSSAAWPAAPVSITAAGAVVPDRMMLMADSVTPPTGAVCPGSLRLARAGRILHAVWWAPRSDSAAWLLAAQSGDDGRSWSAAAPVDTLDRAVTGCTRAPASIAADSASGYVHVAYGLVAPEGPGLFFAHSMDGGRTFHSPVPITYGDHPGRTSVAADGDLVVVGFEDPNSMLPRIGLAVSRTMGHIFEHRLLPVSDDNGAATHPMTAVHGHRVAIAWHERAAAGGPAATSALVVRSGVLH